MGFRSKSKSSAGLRCAALFGLAFVVLHFGPSFNVKGAWDGNLADTRSFPKGLGPQSVTGLALVQNLTAGTVKIQIEDGRAVADYNDGPLSLSVDDTMAWQANFTQDDTSFRAQGAGMNNMNWEASKRGAVPGVGDVEVTVSSKDGFGVSAVPSLPSVSGVDLKASASSHGDAIQARLEAARQLGKDVDVSYAVENAEGDYDWANLAHDARLNAKIGGGDVTLQLTRNGDGRAYNATAMRDLSDLLKSESEATVGVDNDGVYGQLTAARYVGRGVSAAYELTGRGGFDNTSTAFAQTGKLSHSLGSLKVSHAKGEPVQMLLESDITRQGNRVHSEVGYELKAHAPIYNVTISRDLSDALRQLDSAEIEFGIDDVSADGIYGRVAAGRNLGKGFDVQYSSAGRLKSMEHSLKLSNGLGYAEILKSANAEPRLRLGYEFDA